MYRQLTEVMARLEKVEEKSQESEKKHETEIRDLKAAQKEEIRQAGHKGKTLRMADVQRKLQEKGIKIEIEEIGKNSERYKDRLIIDLLFCTTMEWIMRSAMSIC